MRLFLLPISSRRTLLYCERLAEPSRQQTSLVDKATLRAAKLWSDWETKPPGTWQQRVVASGNAALRRIAFEEWGLKSVPPLSARRREELTAGATQALESKDKDTATATATATTTALEAADGTTSAGRPVEVVFPASVIPPPAVAGVLHRLSTEREALHKKRLIWCFVGMPISAPVGLIPLIPNIPFFYLAYRAWSHWRALSGGRHIQHLLQSNALVYTPSPILDAIYAKGGKGVAPASAGPAPEDERLLLSNPDGSKAIAGAFDAPALELELERAIWQVETALAKEKKKKDEDNEAKAAAAAQRIPPPQQQPESPPAGQPEAGALPTTKAKDKDQQ